MLEQALTGVRLVELDQFFGVGGAGQVESQGAAQGPGGIQFVADDQVITHVQRPRAGKTPVGAGLPAIAVAASTLQSRLKTPSPASRLLQMIQVRYSALIFTYSWDKSVVQMVSLQSPRPSSIRMVISACCITAAPWASV
ncbi:hypothetical protein D3C86_1710210 [compost metagenome]